MATGYVLLGTGLGVIALRLYVRVATFGWRGLMADDYLMSLVVAPYSLLTATVYISLVECKGLSNDRMTNEERESLQPGDEEFRLRVRGAKAVVCSRLLYTLTLWLTKAAMLAFCKRLTDRLGAYKTRIRVGFLLLIVTWLSDFLTTMVDCRPFHKNWQIYPDPGVHCYAASSPYGLLGTLSLNITTSLYVLCVPIPILWMAHIKWWKKLGLALLISGNGFVIAVACLRAFFLLTTTNRGGPEQADRWALHVCFVAITTINLPLLFPLINRWISKIIAIRPPFRQLRPITVWERTPTPKSPRRRRVDSGVGLEMGLKLDGRAYSRYTSPEGMIGYSSTRSVSYNHG